MRHSPTQRLRLLAPFLAGGLFLSVTQAQRHLYTFLGDTTGDNFGISVSDAGDVNMDGYADVIVGAHNNNSGAKNGNYARVFSGRDGKILYTFKGDKKGDFFGVRVSGAGDVDKDGYPDVIVGATEFTLSRRGYARVFSGKTGKALYTFLGDANGDMFGIRVSGAGDVNADGYADLVVGADRANSWIGYARVFSGKDGRALYTFKGNAARDMFGRSVGSAGDVNKDGFADVLVGAPNASNATGYARVFSGKDGRVLHTFSGATQRAFFGQPGRAAGDVNGDGYVDLIIGAEFGFNKNNQQTGYAQVFSGKDFKLLYTFYGDSAGSGFGRGADGVGDVDKDGHADLILGANLGKNPQGVDTGYVRVFSGKSGAVLYTLYGESSRDLFGFCARGAGDVNKDGIPDLIIGARWNDKKGSDSGSVRVVSGKPFLAADTHVFSLSKTSTQALTLDAGTGNKGRSYWIFGSVSGTTPGVTLASAIGSVWIPLNVDPWTDITIAVANSATLVNTKGTLDAAGKGKAWIRGGPVNVPGAIGLVLHHAYLVYDGKNNFYMASNPAPLRLTK